jgi:hypothetical protein
MGSHPIHLHPLKVHGEPFKDLTSACSIIQDFFHKSIFEPKNIGSRKEYNDTIQHISGSIYILVPHFHFSVFQPQSWISMLMLQGPLKDTPRTNEGLVEERVTVPFHPGFPPKNHILSKHQWLFYSVALN